MLRSSNPILSKQDAFTPAAPQYGTPSGGYGADPYGRQGYQGYPGGPAHAPVQAPEGRMTFDDVVTKTAITMAILIISAALAWMFVPTALYFPALILSGLVGFGVVLLVAVRRNISPGLVLVYAAIEGIFVQAVIGTFAAAGVTLAAYKFFNIRVTPKFQKIVIISTIAFALAMLVNFVFALLGVATSLRAGITGPVGLLAIGVSLLGAVLAVLNLVLDFDYIEQGVAMGAPAKESWRGAFGLTVTMVWLYVELLRLLSYLRR